MPQQQQCYPALPVADPAPTVVNVQTQQSPPMQVVVVGGCPSCRVSKNVVHFFKISLNINFFFHRSVSYVRATLRSAEFCGLFYCFLSDYCVFCAAQKSNAATALTLNNVSEPA